MSKKNSRLPTDFKTPFLSKSETVGVSSAEEACQFCKWLYEIRFLPGDTAKLYLPLFDK